MKKEREENIMRSSVESTKRKTRVEGRTRSLHRITRGNIEEIRGRKERYHSRRDDTCLG